MEPMRGQDFVHALMVKLNRISIAAILTVIAIYGLVVYRGTTATAAHGSGTSGAEHTSTTGITACSGGSGTDSNDNWPVPVRGPR